MNPTLDDAIEAFKKIEGAGKSITARDLWTLRQFLATVKAMAEPVNLADDAEGFILEHAGQAGFEHIDDDVELLVVSSRKLVDFVNTRESLVTDKMRMLVVADLKHRLQLPDCDEARIGADELMLELNAITPKIPPQPKCTCCGTTENLHVDLGSGGPYRCNSPDCIVY